MNSIDNVTKDEIVAWIAEHDGVYEDFKSYFDISDDDDECDELGFWQDLAQRAVLLAEGQYSSVLQALNESMDGEEDETAVSVVSAKLNIAESELDDIIQGNFDNAYKHYVDDMNF